MFHDVVLHKNHFFLMGNIEEESTSRIAKLRTISFSRPFGKGREENIHSHLSYQKVNFYFKSVDQEMR